MSRLFMFLFLLTSFGSNREISQYCFCGHIDNKEDCHNSQLCQWEGSVCNLKNGATYIQQSQTGFKIECYKYAQEDCIFFKECGFFLGQCVDFQECSIFLKNSCQESSYQCISDGSKCIPKSLCIDYKTEIACSNKNIEENYCYWNDQQQCKPVEQCSQLPSYLMTHQECSSALNNCTVNDIGLGCQDQMSNCNEYKYENQCYRTKNQSMECFWDDDLKQCFEKNCENKRLKTHDECFSYLDKCSTDGNHCIIINQCSDFINKFGCFIDKNGKKCTYYNEQCQLKSCITAPITYNNYYQCQLYDPDMDCVTKQNGGCQSRPLLCTGYYLMEDCYTKIEQDCVWYQDKCEKRECYHAPNYYDHEQCKQYGQCMGQSTGGCQLRPNECNQIQEQNYCDINHNGDRCIWLDNQCKILKCSNLQLPYYDNHQKCFQASEYCTFNIETGGCVDYVCPNVIEIDACVVDSNQNICKLNDGCIKKRCKLAPSNYITNQICESWLPTCTVNVYEFDGFELLFGCIEKVLECILAKEQQCFSTIEGYQCKWSAEDRCQFSQCIDSQTNDCDNFIVKGGVKCIVNASNNGCIDWPNQCTQITNQYYCQQGTSDKIQCIWKNDQCHDISCSDAPSTQLMTNIVCYNFNSACIADQIFSSCISRVADASNCSSSPHNEYYDTHEECYAWNKNCTVAVADNNGCMLKLTNCSDYIIEEQCKSTIGNQYCYWNQQNSTCNSGSSSDCSKRTDQILSHADCENFLPYCTINNFTNSNKFCMTLKKTCAEYTLKQSCKVNFFQQQCIYIDSQNKCIDLPCSNNDIATTEKQCYQYKNSYSCELNYNSDGISSKGCREKYQSCDQIKNKKVCNKSIIQNGSKCLFYNSKCNTVDNNTQCKQIYDATSNSECQYYNKNCLLQDSGIGCYQINSCQELDVSQCSNSLQQQNIQCKQYGNQCRNNLTCDQLFQSYGSCKGIKTSLNILCDYKYVNSAYQCVPEICTINNLVGSNLLKYEQCQQHSSICTYDSISTCVEIQQCSDLTTSGQLNDKFCSNSLTNMFQKCGYNFITNTCENRKCDHLLKTQFNKLSDLDCYNWQSNCIFDGIKCIQFDQIDCTKIKIPQQCLEYNIKCILQGENCVNINIIDCSNNITALTNYECQLVNSACNLDLFQTSGCAINNCNNITDQAICDDSHSSDKIKCKWQSNICKSYTCNEYLSQSDCQSMLGIELIDGNYSIKTNCYWRFSTLLNKNICSSSNTTARNTEITSSSSANSQVATSDLDGHSRCHSDNFMTTIFFTGDKCVPKASLCINYTYQEACQVTLSGIKCIWIYNSCKNFCSSLSGNSHFECQSLHKYCMYEAESNCSFLNCTLIGDVDSCNIFTNICTWNESCIDVTNCNSYNSSTCNAGQDSQGYQCTWDGTTCQQQIIIEQCSQITTYNTHSDCENLFKSKKCTVQAKSQNCVNLPSNCSNATSSQCYIDQSGNKCYYNNQQNRCLTLSQCSDIGDDITTHDQCNSLINECTVQSDMTGCVNLADCEQYTIAEQCKFDSNKQQCQWINIANQCKLKTCETAQFKIYSAGACQKYYNKTCTVNNTFTRCEQAQLKCKSYLEKQCKSDNQMNINGDLCFWNADISMCQEKSCENGPPLASSNSECEAYMPTCQKGGCRIKVCSDYYYTNDLACASIFSDSRCTTNGFYCINRGTCETNYSKEGCTYDINFNDCLWINSHCISKVCQSAPLTYVTNDQCHEYLEYCTAQKDGGCIEKQECSNNLIQESCKTDMYNQGCVWEEQLQQCFSDQCIGFCGDGLITNQFEICDDGNYLPYDGCYKCQIQCPLGCLDCQGKLCMQCDIYGWKLINSTCQPICGDGIVVGTEYCDDGNQIEFDGCYNCQYSCDKYCEKCYQGQCIQCPEGLYEIDSFCVNQCGDGIFASQYEQCEDGNTQNNDGCDSECQIEKFWKCYFVDKISLCEYNVSPKIILELPSKYYGQSQQVLLSFSQPVKLNSQTITEEIFIELIKVSIFNMNASDYQVEIVSLSSITYSLSEVLYQLNIRFFKNSIGPILLVDINCDNLINEFENSLIDTSQQIQLKDPFTISENQKMIAAKAAFFNSVIVYSLIGIGSLAFLSGNMEILWNLIDTLQQLSYMKYFNVQFPENVAIYFEVFGLVTMQPFLDCINIDTISQQWFNYEIPFIPAQDRFEVFQVNCFFGINFYSFFVMNVVGIGYYILDYLLLQFLTSLKYRNWPITVNQEHKILMTAIVKIIHSIQTFIQSYYQYFFYSGIIRIYLSNYYDLTFSSLLQIVNFTQNDKITQINSYGALTVFLFNLSIIFITYIYISVNVKIPQKFSVLLEGINPKLRWRRQFISFQLIKKTLFIINLIIMQKFPMLQTATSSLISGVFIAYILQMMPFKLKSENYKTLISEILIAVNCLLFSASEILILNSKIEKISFIGWMEICGFSIILISCFIIDLTQQLKKPILHLYSKFKNQRERIRKASFTSDGIIWT